MITPPPRTVLGIFSCAGSSHRRGSGFALHLYAVLLALVALGAFACGDGNPNDPQPTTGSLSGTVRDAGTGAPIQGVIVTVANGGLGESGSDGSYRIDNIPVGTNHVAASVRGYFEQTAVAEILPGVVTSLSLELVADPRYRPLTITTSALPQATVDVPYQATLEATGGASPYAWSWGSHGPPGLLLDAAGLVMGTPGVSGWNASYPCHDN